jgi:hypothetical protein
LNELNYGYLNVYNFLPISINFFLIVFFVTLIFFEGWQQKLAIRSARMGRKWLRQKLGQTCSGYVKNLNMLLSFYLNPGSNENFIIYTFLSILSGMAISQFADCSAGVYNYDHQLE